MAQPARPKIKLKIFAEYDRLLRSDGPGGHGKVRRSGTDFPLNSDNTCVNLSGTCVWQRHKPTQTNTPAAMDNKVFPRNYGAH